MRTTASPISRILPGSLVERQNAHQRPGLAEHRGAAWGLLSRRPGRRTARSGLTGQHALLNHLIRPLQQRLRDRESEGLRGLQVDHQLELRWPLDGQLSRLGAT